MTFLSRAGREVLIGIVLGGLSTLAVRVLIVVVRRVHPQGSPVGFHGVAVAVPVAVVLGALLLLFARRIFSFWKKLWLSWFAGIITGIVSTWLGVTLFLFWSQRHGPVRLVLSLAVGLVPIAASGFLARRRAAESSNAPVDVPEIATAVGDFGGEREMEFDLPIHQWNEDRLNRGPLVRSIAELILRDKAPVVAIVGPFGEGKTSALNLLATSFEKRRDAVVVRFSSWLPGDERTLAVSLFATIADHVSARYVVFGLSRELRRFARLLAGMVPRLSEGLKPLFDEPSQTAQVASLRRCLSRLPVRVVVLVDELDRMDTAELLVLLKAIRGVVDLPNLSYVCAFDRDALIRLIGGQDSIYGQSYLEKFFPVQRTLPRIDHDILDVWFDAKLERLCQTFKLLQEERDKRKFGQAILPVWHSSIKRLLSNIRKLSIFFNDLRDALAPVAAEINLFDMIVLQLVRFISEPAYQFIYDNGPLFYYPGWRMTLWVERLSVDDQAESDILKERLREFFESMPKPISERVKTLLKEIFPTVKQYAQNDRVSFRGTREEEAEAEKRIYHPDFFPRYFIHQVPASVFGIAAMSEFIEELNRQPSVASSVGVFREVIDKLARNSWKRWSFLDGLIKQAERLGESQAEAVAIGVAAISDSLEPEVLGFGEWGRARVLVFAAARRVSPADAQRVLAAAIFQSTSDGFAADILRFSTTMRGQNRIITDWTHVDEGALKTALAERMASKYSVGSDREFPFDRLEDRVAFHLWALLGEGERNSVTAFLRDRFQRFPDERGRFLGSVVPKRAIYEGDPLAAVEGVFPTQKLLDSLTMRPLEHVSDSDRESVAWFMELMGKRRDRASDSQSLG